MNLFARIFIPVSLIFATFFENASGQPKVTKAFLTGHFDYSKDTAFVKVDGKYSERVIYLQKTVYKAYIKMHAAALKDGINLNIISGTRSFTDQCCKWGSEWNSPKFLNLTNVNERAETLLRWWSMPGTSRHHWGTDIDFSNMTVAYFKTSAGKKMYAWLITNACKYGFYQPFNAGRATGYQEEKWHWSYMPLSKIYLREYVRQVAYADINGFTGCSAAKQIDVIKNRVLAVNTQCK